MTLPFNLPLQSILIHQGQLRLRFEGDLGDGFLNIKDTRTGGPYQVMDRVTGQRGLPTVDWVRNEYADGRLRLQRPTVRDRNGREREIANLDHSASAARDPKAPWRLRWAIAASKAGLTRTDEVYGRFIEERRLLIISKDGFRPPAASSLRRHVRKLETVGSSTSVFVSGAGRAHGQSQLPHAEDCLVNDIALRYWAEPSWSIKDAHAIMFSEWEALVDAGVEDLSAEHPCYETLRLRVRKLDTYDTVKAKFGQEAADRRFNACGELVSATRPFERVFMDGTELEQIATFGSDLEIAGSKLKSVLLMDAFTTFVFPPVVFPGPYREEMSIEAIIRMMSPPVDVPEDILEQEPFAAWAFGRPNEIIPDNDRTLIPPGYIPALLELGPSVDLPEVYNSDAKSPLETFHKWLKQRLRGLPGTVQLHRNRKDLRRDPVKEAELTPDQHRKIVNRLIWEHNTTPRADLGNNSPLDLMKTYMLAGGGPTLDDVDEPRRTLAKTHVNCVLTNNGLIFDGLHYRCPEVEDVLKDNHAATPVGDRVDGTAKCIVTIRTFEADLDSILVYNEARGDFVRLYSTQPTYTAGLSRWEHDEYRRLARQRGEKFMTEQQRLRSRAASLATIDAEAPSMPFRRRARLAVLKDSEQIRSMTGRLGESGMPASPLVHASYSAGVFSQLRTKAEAPPPGPKQASEATRKDRTQTFAPAGDVSPGAEGTGSNSDKSRDWDAIGDCVDDDMDVDD